MPKQAKPKTKPKAKTKPTSSKAVTAKRSKRPNVSRSKPTNTALTINNAPIEDIASPCSPQRAKHFQVHSTCYTRDELIKFAQDWNVHNNDLKIMNPESMTVPRLYTELRKRYNDKKGCQNEVCWVKASPGMYSNAAIHQIFRPMRPDKWRKGREWLSTSDIVHVLKQYEPVHKDFLFIGVHPVDFEQQVQGRCVAQSICDFTVEKLKASGKDRFGMVINLDKHDEPGSHWVAIFCCVNPKDPKYGACYFDSGGTRPDPVPGIAVNPIEEFLKRIKREVVDLYGPDHQDKFLVRFNPKRKQFKNTECGMFCLLYIILCLEKRELDYKGVRGLIGNDDFVHKFRQVFYTASEYATPKQPVATSTTAVSGGTRQQRSSPFK